MLQPGGNIGLAMRWHAALAEMQAFFDVSVEKRAAIIESFGQTIRAAISERPRFALLPPPEPIRDVRQEAWERMVSVFHRRSLDRAEFSWIRENAGALSMAECRPIWNFAP